MYCVRIYDETPGAARTVAATESLQIACDARGLSYVRAKLIEMGEALDGAVIVT